MTFKLDFEADMAEMLSATITDFGYPLNGKSGFEELAHYYFQIDLRRLPLQPRKVYRASSFICPPELGRGLDLLIGTVETGGDLTPFQSKQVLDQPERQDGLLNSWDIHHFHLGDKAGADGRFVKRTGPLAFARVTPDGFYLLAVLDHYAWHKQDLVRIIHENWPETIAHSEAIGAVGLEQEVTDADVRKLRENGINTLMVSNDGTVLLPIGGGVTTAGTSVTVTMRFLGMKRRLRQLQNHVEDQAASIAKSAAASGCPIPEGARLRLHVGEDGEADLVYHDGELRFSLGKF